MSNPGVQGLNDIILRTQKVKKYVLQGTFDRFDIQMLDNSHNRDVRPVKRVLLTLLLREVSPGGSPFARVGRHF